MISSIFFKKNAVLYASLGLAMLASQSCVNYKGVHHQQHLASPKQFATKTSLAGKNGPWPKVDWVTQFRDPQLTALTHEALAHNPDLEIAVARQNQAKALVEGHNAALYPRVDFIGLVSRSEYSSLIDLWQHFGFAALNFKYELDFWGKNYSLLAQALSQEKVSQAILQSSRLVIQTMVAVTYNQLDYEYNLRDVLQRTVKQRNSFNEITRILVKSGLGTEVQIYQARSLYATARTQLAAVEGQIANTRQQLGVLLGRGPDRGLAIKRPTLSTVGTPQLPNQLPINLIGRRPDIVAARWQVEGALYGVKNVKANFYPNVNLLAVASRLSFGIDRLFNQSNRFMSVAPAVYLPVFDAGLLKAELKGQEAVLDEQIATYNSTLNKALGDVAEQLTQIHSVDQQLIVQQDALTMAKRAYELSIKQYRIGLTSQVVVLDTETRYLEEQQLRLLLIKSRRDLQIALIKALGGGFEERLLPTPRTIVSPSYVLKKDAHV